MDNPIFAQLDRLQRGARETHPRRPAYHEQRASHDLEAYSQGHEYYDDDEVYGNENAFPPTANGMRSIIASALLHANQLHRFIHRRLQPVPSGATCERIADAATTGRHAILSLASTASTGADDQWATRSL